MTMTWGDYISYASRARAAELERDRLRIWIEMQARRGHAAWDHPGAFGKCGFPACKEAREILAAKGGS